MIKKIFFTLLLSIILIPILGNFDSDVVYAEGSYVVEYIEDDGDLKPIESYGSYEDAYQLMITNEDYVICHSDSLSPYKIIAMNSGLVYSYPYRGNSNTMNIYENITSNYGTSGASTYVFAHAEMTYNGTYKYFVSTNNYNYGHGFVAVTLNGFTGYADLEYCDLVPMKYIENGLMIVLGGNSRGNYSSQTSFNIIPRQHYYYAKTNGNYRDLCMEFYENWAYPNNLEPAIDSKIAYGVAPNFMQEGVRYYSDDGINFYYDRNLERLAGTYYNYYQFVPLRSYSAIDEDTIDDYIYNGSHNSGVMLDTGEDFIDNQNIYGVNGAIIAAMGIHESGWGTSNISTSKYNLFGWQAYDANTGAAKEYESVSECIAAQMGDNLSNYLDVKCAYYFSQSLGNKGGGFITKYASDPYWAEQIASFYYGLDKLDNNNNGKLTDFNSVKMALVNTNTQVKSRPSSNSSTLYNTQNKTGYQKNLFVNVLDVTNGYALTRLSNPVINGEVIYPFEDLSKGTKIKYDANASVGYVDVNKLTFINFTPEEHIDESKLAFSSYIRNIQISNSNLYIEGVAAIKGMNFDDLTKISHTLTFYDYEHPDYSVCFTCDTGEVVYNLNDGKNYKYVKFSKTIPLTSVPLGSYGLKMKVKNGNYTKEEFLLCAEPEFVNMEAYVNDVSYRLSCNQLYSYRIEFEVSKVNHDFINYGNITKYSMRQSLLTFDGITFEEDDSSLYLKIKAHAFMYYLDYDNKENIAYNAYLVSDDGNTYKAITAFRDAPTDYAKVLGINNDLTNICFTSLFDLNELDDLDDQNYRIIIEIKNKANNEVYQDFVELTNPDNYQFEDYIYQGKTYSIDTLKVRNRLSLIVE